MLLDVALPLSLAFIMFSLGFGLTFADFGRVFAMPKAALTGMILQIAVVPAVAYILLMMVDLPPALAFGVMILAFCPGGVTSSILTKLAGGNVALSITLTAVVSLISVITVPIFASWASHAFLGDAAVVINVTSIAMSMFAITAVPVMIGLLSRFVAGNVAARTEGTVSKVALVLFVVILLAALASNWQVFIENVGYLGPMLITMNVILLLLGVMIARAVGLTGGDGLCISIEMGVQNAALGITVAGLIAQSGGIPEFAVPAAIYGITMYIITIPGMFLLRMIFGKA